MLAQIFILFALVSAVLSAKNLREEPTAAAVPVDHKRAEAVFKSIMKRNAAAHTSDASFLQKRTEAAAESGKKAAASANKQTKIVTGPWKPMTDGYYITRHRPNVDCSGVSSYLSARRIHHACQSMGSYSWMSGCNHADAEGIVKEVTGYFDNGNCAGEPYYVSEQGMGHCSFNVDNYAYWTPPDMRAIQCAPDGWETVKREGGLLVAFHERNTDPNHPENNDHTCQRPPIAFGAQKFGACELMMDNDGQTQVSESTRFSYVSMTGCSHDGKMTMTGYSDPACSRPLWTGQATAGAPDFNGCMENPAANHYSRTVCLPGHH